MQINCKACKSKIDATLKVCPNCKAKVVLTEYELITQAIKIPDNHLQLLAVRLFCMAVCFAFPFWVMGHWR